MITPLQFAVRKIEFIFKNSKFDSNFIIIYDSRHLSFNFITKRFKVPDYKNHDALCIILSEHREITLTYQSQVDLEIPRWRIDEVYSTSVHTLVLR